MVELPADDLYNLSNQINSLFLGNIIRVLFRKLRSSPAHFRTALRATLLLIPVFGVHFLFYLTQASVKWSCVYTLECLYYLGIVVECLQGAFVATVFCFMNSEVLLLIRKKIRRRFTSISSESLHDTSRITKSNTSVNNTLERHPPKLADGQEESRL